jgi:hypothetical protein
MSKKALSWIIFAAGALWILGTMMAYFEWAPRNYGGVYWKEVGVIAALVLKHVLRHYIIVLIILISSWIVGSRVSAGLKLKFRGMLEESVLTTALGVVLHSMAVMLLGFLHLLYPPVLFLQLIIPLVIWRNTFADIWMRAGNAWRNAKISRVQLILLITLVVIVLMTSLTPLYPPTSLDAVNAYLSIPSAYLDAGWFTLDPYIKYSMAPNNHTLMFTLAMSFGTGITAVLTHWAMWVLLLAALIAFGSRYLSTTGGLCGAIAFALVPVTTSTATWGNAENFAALFAFMSFWAMWRFIESRSRGDAIVAGIFLGFALGVKIFLGMLWFGILLFGGVYLSPLKARFPLKNFLLIVIVSIAMVSPWFIRNFVYFGNPVFPYMNDKFTGGGIFEEYEADLRSDMDAGLQQRSPEANDVTIRNLAQEITFWPSVGSKRSKTGTEPGEPRQERFTERHFHGIGPLFIALLPLLVFVRRRWDVLSLMLILAAFCIAVWFFALKIIYIRYWSFFFPFLLSAGGFAFAETFNLDKQSARKPFGFILMSLISTLAIAHFVLAVNPEPVGTDLPLREAYRQSHLVKNVIGIRLIQELNAMEPEPRVYFLYGATSRYYCDFFVIAGSTSPHNYARFWEHADTGAELATWLREIGITHLMVNEAEVTKHAPKLPNDPSFKKNFTLLKQDKRVALYELRDTAVNPGT